MMLLTLARARPLLSGTGVSRCGITDSMRMRMYSMKRDDAEWSRRCVAGMWYVSQPERTDPSTVLSSVPKLSHMNRERLRHALILVTPRLAEWVDGAKSEFLGEAMNRIYGSEEVKGSGPVSYVGVVDGLPAPEDLTEDKAMEGRRHGAREGLAICLLPRVNYSERDANAQNKSALLRICSDTANGTVTGMSDDHSLRKGAFVSLTFPFANTLFTNGRYNTVFKVQWKNNGGNGTLIPQESPVFVDDIQFTWPESPETFLNFDAPLYALTPRREVISSMGNVVREVKGDKGESLKASLELEAIVPKFLAQHNVDGSAVQLQVFARIMSPHRSTDFKDDVLVNAMIDEDWPYHTLLNEGSVYRVMSGGGGWGKKAGLLSLNPATNFEPPKESESSIFPDPDVEEVSFKGTAEIGALVPVGHTIQFFAAKIVSDGFSKSDAIDYHEENGLHRSLNASEEWGQSQQLVFGNIQAQDSFSDHSVDSDAQIDLPILIKDRFGALLEGGAALALFQGDSNDSVDMNSPTINHITQPINEFKIDAPNAVFRSIATARSNRR